MKRSMGVGLFAVAIGGLLSAGWPAYAAEHGGQEHGDTTTAPAAKEHGGTTQEHGGTTQEHGGTTQEHGGTTQEHGGTTEEHGGQAVQAEPSAEEIRQTIEGYVQGVVQEEGAFPIDDPVTGTARQLEFVGVHDRVGKTGSLYYSCTDMRDTQTGELLDLDFDVQAADGELEIVDARIHKVDGAARYTYDEDDNRIPVDSENGESMR